MHLQRLVRIPRAKTTCELFNGALAVRRDPNFRQHVVPFISEFVWAITVTSSPNHCTPPPPALSNVMPPGICQASTETEDRLLPDNETLLNLVLRRNRPRSPQPEEGSVNNQTVFAIFNILMGIN